MPALLPTRGSRDIRRSLRQIDQELADLISILDSRTLTVDERFQFQRRLEAHLNRFDVVSKTYLEEILPDIYRSASNRASRSLLPALGVVSLITAVTLRDRVSIQRLQREASTDLLKIRAGLERSINNIVFSQGPREIRDQRLTSFFDRRFGRTKITVAGKQWRTDKYAQNIVNIRTATVSREAFRNRYLNNNIPLVRISQNGSSHGKCRKWEGKIFSISGTTETVSGRSFPPIETTRESGGLFHAFCKHTFSPVQL